ncbi:MAG: DinB family protein [Winogradskyella sp.]|uniref:DinB family protein n=1 Tax=Winogradskyella sp. TaxID=1883156 RepID=UPI000F3FBFF5|nr:DinB family protein [Winogradskyella sp.]RNC87110.1 MAG: DinB family protein [Winogradskyella sp.]
MERDTIADLIDSKHSDYIEWVQNQPDEHWEIAPESKWSTGQHTLHLLQTLKAINKALSMPKFLLRYKFGKSNREVRDYDTVVQRYEERLKAAQGKTYKGSQNMKVPGIKDKAYLLSRMQQEQKKLAYKTRKLSDKNLDNLILPHPLMGKMPVRELLMWTSHHTEHHNNTLKEKYVFEP